MTHQTWTSIVVASLIMLGDGALASQVYYRTGNELLANDQVAQILLPHCIDDFVSKWPRIHNGTNTSLVETIRIIPTYTSVDVLFTNTQKYHPINPRASPVLAK